MWYKNGNYEYDTLENLKKRIENGEEISLYYDEWETDDSVFVKIALMINPENKNTILHWYYIPVDFYAEEHLKYYLMYDKVFTFFVKGMFDDLYTSSDKLEQELAEKDLPMDEEKDILIRTFNRKQAALKEAIYWFLKNEINKIWCDASFTVDIDDEDDIIVNFE